MPPLKVLCTLKLISPWYPRTVWHPLLDGLSSVFHKRTVVYDLAGVVCIILGVLLDHPLPWSLVALLAVVYGVRKAREGCFSVPTWRTYYRIPLILLAIHLGTLGGIVSGNMARRISAKRSRAAQS